MTAVEIRGLRKSYGGRTVVDGVDFTVEPGEVFGVLGRNGAGKTTTVECAVGLRTPDDGEVRVFGRDPRVDRNRIRQSVGVQLQRTALHPSLTVIELVRLYRSFYHAGHDPGRLVERLGLEKVRDSRFENLSGGEAQRLSVAIALVGKPRLAVLDELTTGLDSAARRGMWQVIEEMRADGITIILVTHFMEEAERLCDRLAVIHGGKVAALDSPAHLVRDVEGGDRVSFRIHSPLDPGVLSALPGVSEVETDGHLIAVRGRGDLVGAVTSVLSHHDVPATDFTTRSASLDDAFLQITGHTLGEPGARQDDSEECR